MSHALPAPVPLSFELTAARCDEDACAVARTASALVDSSAPPFIAVRSGLAAAPQDRSIALLRHVRDSAGARPVAHLTTSGASRTALTARIDAHLDAGIHDFLALRGDDHAHGEGVSGPVGLTGLLHEVAAARGVSVTVGVAAYPNGHLGSPDSCSDLAALLAKEEAGASFALTQVVFDAASYSSYVARARRAGVTIPIIPGIMAVASPARVRRITALTGVQPPVEQVLELENEQDPRRWQQLAIARAARLGEELVAAGAPALHLYTLNSQETSLGLIEALRGIAGGPGAEALAASAQDSVALVA